MSGQLMSLSSSGWTPLSKEPLVDKYKYVFHGLGHIEDVSIAVDKAVQLVQHFPCPIPVTLQEDVKIKELEQKDTIAKTLKPTVWISSMAMVAKPGKIPICPVQLSNIQNTKCPP